jgi:hypothetical protein
MGVPKELIFGDESCEILGSPVATVSCLDSNAGVEVKSEKVRKLRKKCRSKFSMSVGKIAYNKFGARPLSPANILVTRRWIQKYMEDNFKDLRTCDKNIAIDRALFLSFIPTLSFNQLSKLMDEPALSNRVNNDTRGLFGRIFTVRGADAPE